MSSPSVIQKSKKEDKTKGKGKNFWLAGGRFGKPAWQKAVLDQKRGFRWQEPGIWAVKRTNRQGTGTRHWCELTGKAQDVLAKKKIKTAVKLSLLVHSSEKATFIASSLLKN